MTEYNDPLPDWINTATGAELTGYTVQHIMKLARTGKVTGKRVGRDWLVHKPSLLEYQAAQDNGRKSKPGPSGPRLKSAVSAYIEALSQTPVDKP